MNNCKPQFIQKVWTTIASALAFTEPMNIFARYIRKVLRTRGFDMIHYASWGNLFRTFNIDLIFDVGANAGQTYDSFRWAGFNGPICSFEPNPETFEKLKEKDGKSWKRLPYAISNQTGQLKFNIANNDNVCGFHVPLEGQYRVVREITVPAWRLDELWSKETFEATNILLKIDAEGHDMEVIKGATGILDKIPLIMAEVAPLPRFKEEPPFHDFVNFMDKIGFRVCRVDKNSFNRNAAIDTALDVVFAKTALLTKLQD